MVLTSSVMNHNVLPVLHGRMLPDSEPLTWRKMNCNESRGRVTAVHWYRR